MSSYDPYSKMLQEYVEYLECLEAKRQSLTISTRLISPIRLGISLKSLKALTTLRKEKLLIVPTIGVDDVASQDM